MVRAGGWPSGVATGKRTRQIKARKCTSVQAKIAEHMVVGAEITVLNLTTTVSNSQADDPRPRGFAGHALDDFP
jgi:hypothetical protein